MSNTRFSSSLSRTIRANTRFLALFLLACCGTAFSAPLNELRTNNIESVGAGPSGPAGDAYYSVRAYGYGAHDFIHDLQAHERGTGYRILSAYFKDTGSRWVYLATRNRNGEISRTYFDLVDGAVGARVSGHQAGISPQGGGWYRASIGFDISDVTTVYYGVAETNGVPFFSADPATDRIFFSSAKLEGGSSTARSTPVNAAATRAIWVWKADTVLDANRRQELFTFAANRELNTLYIDARTPVLHNQPALAEFIRLAHSRGLSVELLFGKPEWALYNHHHELLTLIDQAVNYIHRYPDAKPSAVHLDIEAHLVHQWQGDRNAVANQLLDLYEEVDRRVGSTGTPVIADMPVWYDTFSVPRRGAYRPMHEWIIDATDGVALMDYRDTESRILADADTELRYANATGKTMVVGVETMCIEPQQITFCEEGDNVMQSILRSVNSKLRGQYSAYRGVAIHHYEDYRRLRP